MPVYLSTAAFLVFFWSTTPLAIQWSLQGLNGAQALTLRFVLAACALWGWLWFSRRHIYKPGLLRCWLIAGISSTLSMLCSYHAATALSSGVLGVLFGLIPVMTAFFVWLWLGQTPRRNEIGGMLLGLCGLLWVFRDQWQNPQGQPWAIALTLLAVALQAGGTVLLKRSSQGLSATSINAGSLLVGCLLAGIACLIWPHPASGPMSERTVLAIIYLGLVGSALAFVLYYFLVRQCHPNSVALISLITPATSLWLGYWLNNEPLTPGLLLGTALIIGGLGLALWTPRAGYSSVSQQEVE